MEAEFLEFMPATVTIAPWISDDANANPTYGTAVSYSARISIKDELVRSHDGREIVAKGKVYLAAGLQPITTVPTTRDKITLPSQYVPTNPPILDVIPSQDQFGIHHVELVIG